MQHLSLQEAWLLFAVFAVMWLAVAALMVYVLKNWETYSRGLPPWYRRRFSRPWSWPWWKEAPPPSDGKGWPFE